MNNDGFRTLGQSKQLADYDVQPYYLRDRKLRLNVARVDGQLYAFDGFCAQKKCPLSAGLLEGTVIMCQGHGSRYDLRTGEVLRGPTEERLTVYEVRELQGELQVKV